MASPASPRVPCALCGEGVIWVERDDGKRLSINPDPAEFPAGSLGRVNPSLVNGKTNIVAVVPENERWMREYLYQPHHETCKGWKRCKSIHLYDFDKCRAYLDEIRTPPMSQSAREDMEPERYRVRRDLTA